MRNTKQKNIILEIVKNSTNHMSAIEVYNQCRNILPDISLGTVYRNLNSLVESNEIQRIKMNDNVDRYDNNIEHAHFICLSCKKIIDIYDYSFSYKKDSNRVLNCKIKLEGICEKCQKEEER